MEKASDLRKKSEKFQQIAEQLEQQKIALEKQISEIGREEKKQTKYKKNTTSLIKTTEQKKTIKKQK